MIFCTFFRDLRFFVLQEDLKILPDSKALIEIAVVTKRKYGTECLDTLGSTFSNIFPTILDNEHIMLIKH